MADNTPLKEKSYNRWNDIFNHFINDAKLSVALALPGKHVPSPINTLSKKDGFRLHKDFEQLNGLGFDNSVSGGLSGVEIIAQITGNSINEVAHKIHQYLDGEDEISITKPAEIKQQMTNDSEDAQITAEEKIKFTKKTTNNILNQETNASVVNQYLDNRGLTVAIPYLNSDIIGLDSLYYDKNTKTPAMVVQVKNNNGELLFLHRTYLDNDYQKNSSVDTVKKVTTALTKDAYQHSYYVQVNNAIQTDTVHIAEGIETALAVAVINENKHPVLSTISTGGMTKYEPTANIKNVVIWADNDKNEAGIKTAKELANKLQKQGVNVEINLPKQQGYDFLDALNSNTTKLYTSIKSFSKQVTKPTTKTQKIITKKESKKMATKTQTKVNIKNTTNNKKGGDVKKPLTLQEKWLLRTAGTKHTPAFLIKYLKSNNPDIIRDALILSVRSNNHKITKLLIKQANINLKDARGNTVLAHAVDVGNAKAVSLLLNQHNININTADYLGNTALINAMYQKNSNITNMLLEYKDIDINAKNNNNETALTFAIKNNNTTNVKLLLAQGADAIHSDKDNAIILAARQGREMLVMFSDKKILATKDENGKTALMHAINGLESKKTINNIITNMSAASLNIKDSEGSTALIYAIKNNDKASINNLINNSNTNLQDNKGRTALMHAINAEDIKTVNMLIKHHADINLQDNKGNTALMRAVSSSNKTTQTLLKTDIDVNQKDSSGDTALMVAARDNNIKVIIILVKAGADASIKNNAGLTANDIAKPRSIARLAMRAFANKENTIFNKQNNTPKTAAQVMREKSTNKEREGLTIH